MSTTVLTYLKVVSYPCRPNVGCLKSAPGRHFEMKRLSSVIVFVIGAQSFAWGYQNPTSWRLSTDDTTMVVAVQQGIPAVTQLRSTKSGSNWLLAPAPEVLPSSISQQNARSE